MDKYYDLIAYYLIAWQQAAIDNTLYSVVLATLAFLIGIQIVVLIKKSTIAELKQRIVKEKQVSEKLGKRQEELLATQKHDAQLIADVQQEKEKIALNLQETEVQYAEQIIEGESLSQSLMEQNTKTDNLAQSLNDKVQQLEQLQKELDQQKDQLAQSVLNQTKMAEMESQTIKLSEQLDGLNQQLQQLEIDLSIKNNQIKQFEITVQSDKKDADRVVELESQIETLKSANASKQNLQVLEQSNAGSKVELATKLEKSNKKYDQLIEEFNNQLQLLLKQPDSVKQNNGSSKDIEQDTTGVVAKIFSYVSSFDKQDSPVEASINIDNKKVEDPWQKHQQIIDQLIAQYSDQQIDQNRSQKNEASIAESYSKPIVSKLEEETNVATPIPISINTETKLQVNEAPLQEDAGSEKNVNYYEDNNFGQYQEKLKGFFKKLRS